MLLIAASPLMARQPATQPQSGDSVHTWYLQLADRDPNLREQARVNLMGISRAQLPHLEKIVAENRPVHPSQAAVLQDIVMHVYMAGEPYAVAASWGGFVGLRWEHGENEAWVDPPGVIVSQRIPGFVAYRMLRPGDVIVGIEELPGQQIHNRNDLTNLLRGVDAGTTVTFLVLRGGEVQKVPIKLDPRPAAAATQPQESMADLESDRQNKAEAYWSRAFASLVEDQPISAAQP